MRPNAKAGWPISHNPRCITSRRALALLRERDIEPRVIGYLKTPPTVAELKTLLELLRMPAGALPQRRERVFEDPKVDPEDERSAIAAMAEHPILIERPVVIRGGKAVLGRPPERVRELF